MATPRIELSDVALKRDLQRRNGDEQDKNLGSGSNANPLRLGQGKLTSEWRHALKAARSCRLRSTRRIRRRPSERARSRHAHLQLASALTC